MCCRYFVCITYSGFNSPLRVFTVVQEMELNELHDLCDELYNEVVLQVEYGKTSEQMNIRWVMNFWGQFDDIQGQSLIWGWLKSERGQLCIQLLVRSCVIIFYSVKFGFVEIDCLVICSFILEEELRQRGIDYQVEQKGVKCSIGVRGSMIGIGLCLYMNL